MATLVEFSGGTRWIKITPKYVTFSGAGGKIEKYKRSGWVSKYATCRFCGKPLPDRLFAYALDKFSKETCGPECTEAETMKRLACCSKAERLPCVCSHAFKCPVHGTRHYGTHD